MNTAYSVPGSLPVAQVGVEARAQFITRTYVHLLGAIVGFVALEYLFFTTGMAQTILGALTSVNWLFVLGAFMLASWLASRLADSVDSQAMQYVGLALLVTANAVIFVLPLAIAQASFPGVIQSAALVTLVAFSGLTWFVFTTRKDFSFMGSILAWIGIGALVLIAAGVLFGFQLGVFFSVGMVIFAGAAILYDTSNVLHHYPEDRYVAASLQLFASVALLFWYVLRLFMTFGRD